MADIYEKTVEMKEIDSFKIPDIDKISEKIDCLKEIKNDMVDFTNNMYSYQYNPDGYTVENGKTPNQKEKEIFDEMSEVIDAAFYSNDVTEYCNSYLKKAKQAKKEILEEKKALAESEWQNIYNNPEDWVEVEQENYSGYARSKYEANLQRSFSSKQKERMDRLKEDIKTIKDLL